MLLVCCTPCSGCITHNDARNANRFSLCPCGWIVAAFVEVARHGQIRSAAGVLGITEQGLRNRLIALEAQLGAELYRKVRGPRRLTPLTDAGQRFLPHALAFLERAHDLCDAFDVATGRREIRIAAS